MYQLFDESENARKGYLFEQWVVSQFSDRKFVLQDWRSDKHIGDIYPASSRNPDLVFKMYVSSWQKMFFAIECKWRSKIYESGLDWATISKRVVYYEFGTRLKMPVHIAIGIGGSPDQPEKTYLIPFEKIRYDNFIEKRTLDEFTWPENMEKLKAYLSQGF